MRFFEPVLYARCGVESYTHRHLQYVKAGVTQTALKIGTSATEMYYMETYYT